MEENEVAVNTPLASDLNDNPDTLMYKVYGSTVIELEGKDTLNQWVRACGISVSLLGLVSIAAQILSLPQPNFLSREIVYWPSLPTASALFLLGFGLIFVLDSRFYKASTKALPRWLNPARLLTVITPGVIGLYFVIQYAIRANWDLIYILSHAIPGLSATLFAAVCALISSLSLIAFWRWGRKSWVSVYLVGVPALYLIDLSLFVGLGRFYHLFDLYNLKFSLFAAAAFNVIGVAMLLATVAHGGIIFPLFSKSKRVKAFSILSLLSGGAVLMGGIFAILTIHQSLRPTHILTAQDIDLYVGLELASIFISLLVIILSLQALAYYCEALAVASEQSTLARKETSIRQIIQAVHSTLDLNETFQQITDELGRNLQVDRCFISRIGDGKLSPPTREYRVSPTIQSMLNSPSYVWERLNLFAQFIARSPEAIEFASHSPAVPPEAQVVLEEIQVASGIGCKVSYRGECKAVLFLHQVSYKRHWTAVEKDIIQIVADQIAVAIYQTELYDKLKKSEQRFRLLVNGAKEYALILLDPEGIIVTWNPGAERMMGYTAPEILGQHFSKLFPPGAAPHWYFSHLLETVNEIGHLEEESQRQRQDGTRFWANVAISALYDDAGTLVGYSKLMRDVTERRKVAHELETAKEEAELANRRKSQALANMSHEFKTSLNAIIGYADMLYLGKAKTASRLSRYANNIGTSGRYLLVIVNDILDIAQAESGKMQLHPQWLDPGKLLLELEPVIRPEADLMGLELHFDVAMNLPQVFWDGGRVKQAFLNLLSNAVKYNQEHGTVIVRLFAMPERDYIIGQVQDSGIGIPKDKLHDIFTEFFRVDVAAQTHPGTGLGLTLTNQLVALHNGKITVDSVEGVGSTFTISLPVNSPALQENSRTDGYVDTSGSILLDGPGRKSMALLEDSD